MAIDRVGDVLDGNGRGQGTRGAGGFPGPPWFLRWLRRHIQLCPHERWPVLGTPEARAFYRHWGEVFARRGVTEEQANLASELMAISPPRFPGEHLGVILAALAARTQAQAERRSAEEIRANCVQHEALCDRRAEWRARWEAMPEDERERIRQAVLAEVPAAVHLRVLLERLCVDRAGQQLSRDGD